MKYYATITSSSGRFEICGTKESLIQDLKRMERSQLHETVDFGKSEHIAELET